MEQRTGITTEEILDRGLQVYKFYKKKVSNTKVILNNLAMPKEVAGGDQEAEKHPERTVKNNWSRQAAALECYAGHRSEQQDNSMELTDSEQ